MKNIIYLKSLAMTPLVMQNLEDRGLIIRLSPGKFKLPAEKDETLVKSIYESDNKYGSHKLITVTVNRSYFSAFGTHPDNEDFLFIGDPNTKPLYLVISMCMKDKLKHKIESGSISSCDFICLRVKYNDPEVSFFTMLKDVPHDEVISEAEAHPASFYVTEPCSMGLEFTEFKNYELKINNK
jgi:hypothetical protein